MRTADKNWSAHGEILDGTHKIAHFKQQIDFFGGEFHRHKKNQISFHFKDIFAQENPLSDLQFESNYLTTFKAWLLSKCIFKQGFFPGKIFCGDRQIDKHCQALNTG